LAEIPCPHLNSVVELTDEREAHISVQHPDLLPEHRNLLLEAISQPDRVFLSPRDPAARLFSRWFPELAGGKHVIAVILSDTAQSRFWIVTAYITRRLPEGVTQWQRS